MKNIEEKKTCLQVNGLWESTEMRVLRSYFEKVFVQHSKTRKRARKNDFGCLDTRNPSSLLTEREGQLGSCVLFAQDQVLLVTHPLFMLTLHPLSILFHFPRLLHHGQTFFRLSNKRVWVTDRVIWLNQSNRNLRVYAGLPRFSCYSLRRSVRALRVCAFPLPVQTGIRVHRGNERQDRRGRGVRFKKSIL